MRELLNYSPHLLPGSVLRHKFAIVTLDVRQNKVSAGRISTQEERGLMITNRSKYFPIFFPPLEGL